MKSVLVVGLDGATWKVLARLIKRNRLPFMQSLLKNSAHGILESTIPPLSAPAWVTFQTGVNPGKHGIFEFLNYRTPDGTPEINTAKDIKSKPIWDILAEYKLKSLVINMPLSYPVKKMNGIIISSFLTPVDATYAYPKSVENILKGIDYEIDLLVDKAYGLMPDKPLNANDRKYYLKRLLEISEKRLNAYKLLSKKDRFAFQFVLFKECDVAQHLFWGLSELDNFYISLDSILKQLFEEYKMLTGENNFIIISDHGFHKAATKQFSPYVMMEEIIGKLSRHPVNNIWRISANINRKLKRYGVLPTRIRILKSFRSRLLNKGRSVAAREKQIIPTFFGIYFNLKNPNEKKESVLQVLKALKATNKKYKIFDVIFRPEELYRGPHLDSLPDIIWKVNEKYTIDTSPFADKLISKRISRLRGDHEADPYGIFIVQGKSIKTGKAVGEKIQNVPFLILKLLDLPIPWYFDGQMPEFFVEKLDEQFREKVHTVIDKEIKSLK